MYFWGGASDQNKRLLRPNEAVQWYAMRYWKERGMDHYDMGGGGDYKRKYGGEELSVPWLRKSKYPLFPAARNLARVAFRLGQRMKGMGSATPEHD